MDQIIFLIPLLPLIGFAINGLFNRSLPVSVSSWIACGSVGLSFALSLWVFFNLPIEGTQVTLYNWFSTGNLSVNFAFLVDRLTSVFLLVITGVGFLIHVYSAGYMHDDDGIRRFFTYLNLFVFFMLLLVMGDSYLMMFIGWEGVGLCSYLLIGFWFKNIDYSKAAKKAFVMNRIGDLGLLLGMFILATQFDSLEYGKILNANAISAVGPTMITLATILLFIGAIGKSAQIPLFTWLPDAMAGPTPVSALIHAATMVTAGVYMVARSSELYAASPLAMNVVLVVGLVTALLAASIGIYQNDIKKVLAYSTVSQLGLMFAALGVGGFTAAVFHVVTHAFFKALLFLGAGSVIHGMGGEQDIRKMGGLKKGMPVTFITFLIGTIAIAGIPPFAGFFSKDQILAELFYKKGIIVYCIGIAVSLMTCFYMFRLLFLTFYGKFRGTHEQEHHFHESPKSMTIPLMVLAVFAAFAGFAGFPHGIGHDLGIHHWFDDYLKNAVVPSEMHFTSGQEWGMIGLTLALIAAVVFFAYTKYVSKSGVPSLTSSVEGLPKLITNKYYIDEAYDQFVTKPIDAVGSFSERVINDSALDKGVNGIGGLVRSVGSSFRHLQTGNLGSYLFIMVLAMVVLIIASIF